MGLMRSVQSPRLDLDDIIPPKEMLPDVTAYWTPYPLDRTPLPFHANALAQARFEQAMHIQELNDLALSPNNPQNSPNGPQNSPTNTHNLALLGDSMLDLRKRITEWYGHLPPKLRRDKIMPAGLFELQ